MKSFSQHAYDRDHELALMEDFMREGVNDPGIFKAFFTAGGPGSGKSYVAQNIGAGGSARGMSPYGLKVIDSDPLFKQMLRQVNLTAKPEDIFSPKGQEVRGKAKALTKKQQANYIEGRLGLLIDGTGKDYTKIKKMSDALRGIGYDTFMLFVNTSLDVAIIILRPKIALELFLEAFKECRESFFEIMGAQRGDKKAVGHQGGMSAARRPNMNDHYASPRSPD